MAYTKKIQIQKMTEIADDIGQQIPQWQTIFEPWASVNGVGGREYYKAAQVNSENDMIFRVRYSRKIADMLTSEARIIYNGKIYDIKHIEDYYERHAELVIRTQQRDGAEENE